MLRVLVVLIGLGLLLIPVAAEAQQRPVSIVAAETVYGDIARQIAGPQVEVRSILGNPDEDPHLFEASPSVARAIADASIVVLNGAEYDPWMRKLLRATPRADRQVIDVGALLHVRPGANPHLWYDPSTMPVFARALAEALAAADRVHEPAYHQGLARFLGSLAPLANRIEQMRKNYTGTPVAATEPVFGLMATAVGLTMRNQRFQLAVMNDTEPNAHDIAAFEHDLRSRAVRVLLYNSQATDSAARRMMRIAEQFHVPVVGVTETEPAGKAYQQWMLDQLAALEIALAKPAS